MKKILSGNAPVTILCIALLSLSTGGPVRAQGSSEGSVAAPRAGEKADSAVPPEVILPAISAKNLSIRAVLEKMAASAKIGLSLMADEAQLSRPVTVMLPKMPLSRALDIVLADAALTATFENGALIVRDAKPPVASAPVPVLEPSSTDEPAPAQAPSVKEVDPAKEWQKVRDHLGKEWKKRHPDSGKSGAERVEVGGDVNVAAGETVETAVAVGGSTTVAGHVAQDAVAIGGTMRVKSGAVVEKDAVSVGGDVIVESGARVGGEVVSVGGTVTVADDAVVVGDRVSVNVPVPGMGSFAGLLGALGTIWIVLMIVKSFFILTVALLLAWLVPDRIRRARDHLARKWGWSSLSGLLIFLGAVPLLILLIVTVVGIPLVPFLILLIAAMGMFGATAVMYQFGQWIPLFKTRKDTVGSVILGFIPFLVLSLIPILGGLFGVIVALLGVGATFLSRFGGREVA